MPDPGSDLTVAVQAVAGAVVAAGGAGSLWPPHHRCGTQRLGAGVDGDQGQGLVPVQPTVAVEPRSTTGRAKP